MTDTPPTTHANLDLIHQAMRLLDRVDEETFTRTTPLAPEGSVGRHLRHCLNFYHCFLEGLDEGRVDYTRRERETAIETNPAAARERLREIEARLADLCAPLHRPLWVREEGTPGGEEDPGWCRSSVHRELQFLLSHTIHHFALIGMLLRAGGVEPEERFGIAPSTLRHLAEGGRCAS